MKSVIAILACIAVGITTALFWQFDRIENLERAVAQIKAAIPKESASEGLELQRKCAVQAKEEFENSGYAGKELAGFQSHYNAELKRCFVEVSHTDTKTTHNVIWTWRFVHDAFEGKEYGVYAWHTVEDKKYWEVPPFQCEVTLPSGEKTICHSDDEFTQLVEPYMGGPLVRKRPNSR